MQSGLVGSLSQLTMLFCDTAAATVGLMRSVKASRTIRRKLEYAVVAVDGDGILEEVVVAVLDPDDLWCNRGRIML